MSRGFSSKAARSSPRMSYLPAALLALVALLMVGSLPGAVATSSGAPAPMNPVSPTYEPGTYGPAPALVYNATWYNQSFSTPLGYTYVSGNALAAGTLRAVASPFTPDPYTISPVTPSGTFASIAAPGVLQGENFSFNLTTRNCAGHVSSGCNQWWQSGNAVLFNDTTNGTNSISTTINPSTGMKQLTLSAGSPAPAKVKNYFQSVGGFLESFPVSVLGVNPAYDMVTMEYTISHAGADGCSGPGYNGGMASGYYCAIIPIVSSKTPTFPAGPFSVPCAYGACDANTAFQLATGTSTVNVTTTDGPLASNFPSAPNATNHLNGGYPGITAGMGESVYLSFPVSALQADLSSGAPDGWSNFSVGLAVIQDQSTTNGAVFVNLTGFALSTTSNVPYVPGTTTNAGNTTTGTKWTRGTLNYTDAVLAGPQPCGAILSPCYQHIPDQFNLTSISPTWGAVGWVNSPGATTNGGGYSVALEEPATMLPTANVTVTTPASSNTLPAYRVSYNFSWGAVMPTTYNVDPVTFRYVWVDPVELPAAAYINVTDVLSYGSAVGGALTTGHHYWTNAYAATEAYSWPMNMVSCIAPNGGSPTEKNATDTANYTRFESGQSCHAEAWGSQASYPAMSPVHPRNVLPNGYFTAVSSVDYTIQYTQAEYNVTICPLYPTANGCPTEILPPPPVISSPPGISVTGAEIVLGFLLLAALVAGVYFFGKHEEKGDRAGRMRSRRGVGRLSPRSKMELEHDASGIGWFLIGSFFVIAFIFWTMTNGILGAPVSESVAVVIAVILFAAEAIFVVMWESTAERTSKA